MTTLNTTYAARTGNHRGYVVFAVLVALALVCALAAWFAPTKAQAATSTTVQMKVEQKFKTDTTGVNDKFLYRLEAVTKGAPMPQSAKNGVYTWAMKGSTKKTVDIELAGVERNVPFTYKMYQVTPDDTDGYLMDGTVYYPEVTLLGSGTPRYIVRLDDGNKPSKMAWAVEYDSTTIGDDGTPTGEGDDDDPNINDDGTPTDGSSNDDPDVDEDDDDDVDVDDGDTPTSPVSTGDALMLGVCGMLVVSLAGAAFALRMRDRKEDDRD